MLLEGKLPDVALAVAVCLFFFSCRCIFGGLKVFEVNGRLENLRLQRFKQKTHFFVKQNTVEQKFTQKTFPGSFSLKRTLGTFYK